MKAEELTREEELKALKEAKTFLTDDLDGEVIYNESKDEYVIKHLQFAIDGVERAINNLEEGMKRFDPVPITPEILEKNGFTKVTEGNRFWQLQDLKCRVELTNYYVNWGLFIVSLEDEGEVRKPIEYIHQLQHFMRGFEIEKEITL